MAKRSVLFLILSVALLIGLGITMLASTSFFTKEGGGEAYVTVWKQVMWVGLSIAACMVAVQRVVVDAVVAGDPRPLSELIREAVALIGRGFDQLDP